MNYVRAIWYGPVCAGVCEHQSCWVVACPSLFRAVVRTDPRPRTIATGRTRPWD